jgi:hypothetical protein
MMNTIERERVEFEVLDLLDIWWKYERRWLPVDGFPAECPSTKGWNASRQWDDANGSLDCEMEVKLAQRIGFLVSQIDQPWRTVLHLLARNRSSGVSVWSSPVMPEDRIERANLVASAIDRFRALI